MNTPSSELEDALDDLAGIPDTSLEKSASTDDMVAEDNAKNISEE